MSAVHGWPRGPSSSKMLGNMDRRGAGARAAGAAAAAAAAAGGAAEGSGDEVGDLGGSFGGLLLARPAAASGVEAAAL